MAERDFLDRIIAKRTARNPEFPRLLDAVAKRSEHVRALAEPHEDLPPSQRHDTPESGRR